MVLEDLIRVSSLLFRLYILLSESASYNPGHALRANATLACRCLPRLIQGQTEGFSMHATSRIMLSPEDGQRDSLLHNNVHSCYPVANLEASTARR